MKKRVVAILLAAVMLAGLTGCSAILDGETLSVTAHQEPTATKPHDIPEAGSYSELKEKFLGIIWAHEDYGLIRVDSYDGDLKADVTKVCDEILNDDPIGSYAVKDLNSNVTQIVSYYEVELHVAYKSITKDQLDSIITISTLRYLKSDLQDMLSDYSPSMTVLLKNVGLSADEALSYVSQTYYENPMDIVMMPVTTVEFYPNHGTERIMEYVFGYRYEDSTLRAMEKSLNNTVSSIAESVTGNSDAMILLALARRLTEITTYDEETASSGEYSNQNTSATAYGALITGSAIGEGYAMAYKALCDELGLECHVVLGKYNGHPHAWNIVGLDGHYYHVDVAMCDINGMSTAFLKKDSEIKKKYSWDTSKYQPCDGPLTYASLTGNS